jgi:hypothetical protein
MTTRGREHEARDRVLHAVVGDAEEVNERTEMLGTPETHQCLGEVLAPTVAVRRYARRERLAKLLLEVGNSLVIARPPGRTAR